jgi:hypothetical protein
MEAVAVELEVDVLEVEAEEMLVLPAIPLPDDIKNRSTNDK